ncbi:hypothetical protein BU23DRAFT_555063 [Bimuria novae-zelandiae CBS 107.79]|uniref:Uncharacterized protein n=1 Tax=Bimuria novae-zelandiae CBS 107.79 TaxID=1447943 RepID=A0A6A5V8D5_9PLEO|nr:hypothetical protein BU23DRAFT_555063 [Bimuria novae-zelandiae CBS 107.79]
MAAVTPTPTFAPTGTYIPPPSHAVTYFTPAPSCTPDKLWLVSTQLCSMSKDDWNNEQPSWAECALTLAGDPHGFLPADPDCYAGPGLRGDDGNALFISECPVGYTQVWAQDDRAFDQTTWITVGDTSSSSVDYKDVVAHSAVCCPDNQYGGFKYNYDESTYVNYVRTTDPAGNPASVFIYVPPRCVATSACNVPPTVTLDAVFNSGVSDKKRKRQAGPDEDIPQVGVVTRTWGSDNVLFAHSVEYAYTVFHGTYTCFENCYDYYTYSYDNTDPSLPSSTLGPFWRTETEHIPEPTCSASPTRSGPGETGTIGTGGSGFSTPSLGHDGQGYNATWSGGYGNVPSQTGSAGYVVHKPSVPAYSAIDTIVYTPSASEHDVIISTTIEASVHTRSAYSSGEDETTVIETVIISTHTIGVNQGYNATVTPSHYSVASNGTATGPLEETGTGSASPSSPSEFLGAAAKGEVSYWFASLMIAMLVFW